MAAFRNQVAVITGAAGRWQSSPQARSTPDTG